MLLRQPWPETDRVRLPQFTWDLHFLSAFPGEEQYPH